MFAGCFFWHRSESRLSEMVTDGADIVKICPTITGFGNTTRSLQDSYCELYGWKERSSYWRKWHNYVFSLKSGSSCEVKSSENLSKAIAHSSIAPWKEPRSRIGAPQYHNKCSRAWVLSQ